MDKETIKTLAFEDIYSSVVYAETNDLNTDEMTTKEKQQYFKYFNSFKNKVLKHLDKIQH